MNIIDALYSTTYNIVKKWGQNNQRMKRWDNKCWMIMGVWKTMLNALMKSWRACLWN